MHTEIRQDHPGSCPKCGMALEPLIPELEEEENPELRDFQHRFWWTLPLTIIVTVLAMFGHQLHLFDEGEYESRLVYAPIGVKGFLFESYRSGFYRTFLIQ